MIDGENLVWEAKRIMEEIKNIGLPKGALRNQLIQDIIKEGNIYSLILIVKDFSSSSVPNLNDLLQANLIWEANELEKLAPAIEDYDLISRDIQHFTELLGKKYILALVIRLFD